MDEDNACLQPAWAGFQDAGLVQDSAGLSVKMATDWRQIDKDNPRVEVEITESK